MLDLGINNASIQYEVALEALGQRRQPLMRAIADERAKSEPSEAFVRYCESRLEALDALQDELVPGDLATITRILTMDAAFTAA